MGSGGTRERGGVKEARGNEERVSRRREGEVKEGKCGQVREGE